MGAVDPNASDLDIGRGFASLDLADEITTAVGAVHVVVKDVVLFALEVHRVDQLLGSSRRFIFTRPSWRSTKCRRRDVGQSGNVTGGSLPLERVPTDRSGHGPRRYPDATRCVDRDCARRRGVRSIGEPRPDTYSFARRRGASRSTVMGACVLPRSVVRDPGRCSLPRSSTDTVRSWPERGKVQTVGPGLHLRGILGITLGYRRVPCTFGVRGLWRVAHRRNGAHRRTGRGISVHGYGGNLRRSSNPVVASRGLRLRGQRPHG
jgi:hypothetical protein